MALEIMSRHKQHGFEKEFARIKIQKQVTKNAKLTSGSYAKWPKQKCGSHNTEKAMQIRAGRNQEIELPDEIKKEAILTLSENLIRFETGNVQNTLETKQQNLFWWRKTWRNNWTPVSKRNILSWTNINAVLRENIEQRRLSEMTGRTGKITKAGFCNRKLMM